MAEPAREFTVNDEPITAREMRNRLDHLDALVHTILSTVQEFATPEHLALLQRFASNPALKWAARKRTET